MFDSFEIYIILLLKSVHPELCEDALNLGFLLCVMGQLSTRLLSGYLLTYVFADYTSQEQRQDISSVSWTEYGYSWAILLYTVRLLAFKAVADLSISPS